MVWFSSKNYWMNANSLKNPYNQSDTIYYDANGAWDEKFKLRSDDSIVYPNIYDSNLTEGPDFDNWENGDYSIAYYVEQYKTKLIEMGAPSSIRGRLLTYEEAYSSQTIEDNGTSIIDTGGDYWLGSAASDTYIYAVWSNITANGLISVDYIDSYNTFGVRPVIEIPTSALQ